jgi:hypothetical protein
MATKALATATTRAVTAIASPTSPCGPLPSQCSCIWRSVSTTGPSNSMPAMMSAVAWIDERTSLISSSLSLPALVRSSGGTRSLPKFIRLPAVSAVSASTGSSPISAAMACASAATRTDWSAA